MTSVLSHGNPIPREEALILCCARTVVDEATVGRIQRLIVEGIDWQRFLERTFHHRITPLVHRTLDGLRQGTVPREVTNALARRCAAIAHRNLFLLAQMIDIGRWLSAEGIPSVAYKGPALAVMAYGNLALREFGDLDFLVERQHYAKAREAFLARHYRYTDDWGWECTMVDDRRAVSVDIHEFLTPRQFPVALHFEDLQHRVLPVRIAGGALRSFCPEDLMIVLCIQLAKDTWGPRNVRLSKLCDIAEMLRSQPGLDWDAVVDRARRAGVLRMLQLGMRAAQAHLGAPVRLDDLPVASARSDALVRHFLVRLLNERGAPASGTMSSERFYFHIRERWREKVYPWVLEFRERLPPNDRDRAVVPLPDSLQFLYYVIRPFRVFGSYVMAGVNWLRAKLSARNR